MTMVVDVTIPNVVSRGFLADRRVLHFLIRIVEENHVAVPAPQVRRRIVESIVGDGLRSKVYYKMIHQLIIFMHQGLGRLKL